MSRLPQQVDAQSWRYIFDKLDNDHDGFIPMTDLKTNILNAGDGVGLSAAERDQILHGVDVNRDDYVDFPEFCLLMSRVKHMRLMWLMFKAAQMVVPKSQRSEPYLYLKQFNCLPPPVFILLVSLAQIGVYIYYVLQADEKFSISGPTPVKSIFIYDPHRKKEVWRFVTYMLVHVGIYHLVFNVAVQLVLGLPLELVHKYWRVALVYLMGVLAGSLASAVFDPRVFLAGASGGAYALLAAHFADLLVNWSEMEFALYRLLALVVVISTDVGVAAYDRYKSLEGMAVPETNVSYAAHFGGFLAGLLAGILVLRNLKSRRWERTVWWAALLLFLSLALISVTWIASHA